MLNILTMACFLRQLTGEVLWEQTIRQMVFDGVAWLRPIRQGKQCAVHDETRFQEI